MVASGDLLTDWQLQELDGSIISLMLGFYWDWHVKRRLHRCTLPDCLFILSTMLRLRNFKLLQEYWHLTDRGMAISRNAEDAASLCKVILEKRYRGHVFMGCDGSPLSRQEMMDEVNTSGKFKEKFKGFTGGVGPLGKKMDNTKTRNEIGWEPKYRSFAEFLHISS